MTIIIRFNDNIEHQYYSFDELLQLPNYNEITHLDCYNNYLTSLPQLPNSLIELSCYNNNLTSLPELPNSLTHLNLWNDNLTNLPQLPNSLTHLHCSSNNLTNLPQLPNSLNTLICSSNNLKSLPLLPNSLNYLCYSNNPIVGYIKKYFNDDWREYREFQHRIQNRINKTFANKIGEWFLECKYNPKYRYCREKMIMKGYNELYTF